MAKNKTYEEQLRQSPGTLLQKLLKELADTKAFDVHFEEMEDESGAVVKVNDYEEDTETALRLLLQGRWALSFGYYNEKDDFIELLQPLEQAEISLIPNGLQKGMLKVLESEEGLRLPGILLTK
ncbi:hypothetical protein SAMN05421788_107228 [Filimonas lacunae]|uniref:Uncharacterized protein n=1 Tax=Filimonas lacunae TaxID=477680 RepID=A0A173MG07_9BACT|nr:hypothetical protein [Filimonas lacunae]BAV06564.1 hypothetical protein FLA_2583 [Filimonas lacunae]SIT27409.1 hypothetical protein SAMN05421788_107228 [Filimonas lacunae]